MKGLLSADGLWPCGRDPCPEAAAEAESIGGREREAGKEAGGHGGRRDARGQEDTQGHH